MPHASCSLPFHRVVCLMQRLWTPPPPPSCVCGSQLPSHAAWPFYHRLWCLLQALLEAFDASHVTSSMLWALIQAWCGDVAAALAAHAADVDSAVQLAANAAAGRWNAVVSTGTFSLSTAGCWTCLIDWPSCSGDKLAAVWCSSCARLCTVVAFQGSSSQQL